MQAIAHGGVRTHVRESAMKVDSRRKIPCHTGESNLNQRRASPMLYQLSYIPTPIGICIQTRLFRQASRLSKYHCCVNKVCGHVVFKNKSRALWAWADQAVSANSCCVVYFTCPSGGALLAKGQFWKCADGVSLWEGQSEPASCTTTCGRGVLGWFSSSVSKLSFTHSNKEKVIGVPNRSGICSTKQPVNPLAHASMLERKFWEKKKRCQYLNVSWFVLGGGWGDQWGEKVNPNTTSGSVQSLKIGES